ncbi:MAG: hypothetical protein WBL43_03200 [Pseudolabrys sp.]
MAESLGAGGRPRIMLLWVILLVAAAVGLYAIIIFNSLVGPDGQ